MYGSGVWLAAAGGCLAVCVGIVVWAWLTASDDPTYGDIDRELHRRGAQERAARNGIGRPRSGDVSNVVPVNRRPVCVVVESSFESPTETMLQYRRRIDEHPDGAA